MPGTPAVAFVHYHLRGGGVTRVIHQTQRIFKSQFDARTVVFSGEPPCAAENLDNVNVIAELAYGDSLSGQCAEKTCRQMERVARDVLGTDDVIWHFHNHHLGKNAALPMIAHMFAKNQRKVLLQIHDFPEDGRSANYAFLKKALAERLNDTLYPSGNGVHYAVLNFRDMNFLQQAGCPQSRVHHLPNPVHVQSPEESSTFPTPPFENLQLYPTRAIRRKNIGECVLWSSLLENADIGLTMAPQNPAEVGRYQAWVDFAAKNSLPMHFELSAKYGYANLMNSCSQCISTSVGEGFGLAFLEPWLMGKPICGRKLPEITDEFEQLGVDLSGMYSRLNIPIEWIGAERLRNALATGLANSFSLYGKAVADSDVELAWNSAVEGEMVDFAKLDEPMQMAAIEKILSNRSSARQAISLTPLRQCGGEKISANAAAIGKMYSPDGYGRRLMDIYRTMEQDDGLQFGVDGESILRQFLRPERFYLLRS